jgi:divalent metal cation (Fe/Co/Zn/Cd) transporter
VISAAILVLLWGTVRSIGRRLMDGVEPELVDRLVHALAHTDGVVGVERPQLRWTGHRLSGAAVLTVTAATPHAADAVVALARANAVGRLRNLDELVLEHRTATPETALPHPEP